MNSTSTSFPKIEQTRNSQLLSPHVHKAHADMNKSFFNEDR